jgi:hypothetical protein
LARTLGVNETASALLLEALTGVFTFAGETPASSGGALEDERLAMAAAMRLTAPLAKIRMQRRLDALDRELARKARCECGAHPRSLGQRERTWVGVGGEIALQRRWVQCGKCRSGFAPAQDRVGLGETGFTPYLEEVATMIATSMPHGQAARMLAQTMGIEISEHGLQEMVERRGKATLRLLAEQAERLHPYDAAGLPREVPGSGSRASPDTVYLEVDGVLPMTREEKPFEELSAKDKAKVRRAKKDKARGGRGRRYRLVGKEVKNAVIYDGSDCAQESASRGCLLQKHYVSHLGEWQKFAPLVWAALCGCGHTRAKRLVILSDGAEWIRSLADWLPREVLLILDLFHVKHRIWEVAHAVYGESPKAGEWARTQCDRAEAGQAPTVISALRFLNPRRKEAAVKVRELGTYLANNLDRMDYPAYKKAGLRVTSGIVESANFHVTGQRLKLQGMRWSEDGAREMACLRADLFNGIWQERSVELLAQAA